MDEELEVIGAVANPLRLTVDDLRRYPAYAVTTSFLSGEKMVSMSFLGARLWDVMQSAQVRVDPAQDPKLRIMARAKDNFRCLIRWHEFDPAAGNKLILIAYQQDEEPLGTGGGPIRLVVPGDVRGTRNLRGLV